MSPYISTWFILNDDVITETSRKLCIHKAITNESKNLVKSNCPTILVMRACVLDLWSFEPPLVLQKNIHTFFNYVDENLIMLIVTYLHTKAVSIRLLQIGVILNQYAGWWLWHFLCNNQHQWVVYWYHLHHFLLQNLPWENNSKPLILVKYSRFKGNCYTCCYSILQMTVEHKSQFIEGWGGKNS